MRGGNDEGLAFQDRIGNERLGRQSFLERNGGVELRALAFLAFDPDAAAHHLAQFAADRQAETRAAVFPRGGSIDLGKGLEEAIDLVRGNADAGVPNGKENEVFAAFVFRTAHADTDVALGGESHGVGEKVDQDLPQSGDIAVEAGWQVRLDYPEEIDAFFTALKRHAIDGFLDEHGEVEGMILELELARFDFGKVENLTDDGQQRVGALPDCLRIVALLGREIGAEQQAGHADDGVHRRADFVAHVGQEFRLGLVGVFRRFLGGDDFLLDLLALGDVFTDAAVADQGLAVRAKHGRSPRREPDEISILGLRPELKVAKALGFLGGVIKLGCGDDDILLDQPLEEAALLHFLGGVAEDVLHALGNEEDFAVGGGFPDILAWNIDDFAETRLA